MFKGTPSVWSLCLPHPGIPPLPLTFGNLSFLYQEGGLFFDGFQGFQAVPGFLVGSLWISMDHISKSQELPDGVRKAGAETLGPTQGTFRLLGGRP